jgi:UDP-N-acetylglucosamine 2-epimerase (non-hydrolysing)
MKIISVVGARPNFMKIAPFIRAIEAHNEECLRKKAAGGTEAGKNNALSEPVEHILVHTGQHYDDSMSKAFFADLGIPQADINLQIGSGTHAEQVGQTMMAFEKVLKAEKPDWVVVVGDVNATLACSVTAKKEWIKVCHIEAGLRSNDLTMPEEINRLVTDRLSDLLLAPDRLSIENLMSEGTSDSRIRFVGNIMIDTLEANREKAALLSTREIIENNLINDIACRSSYTVQNTAPGNQHQATSTKQQQPATNNFAVVTLHRPSNVDSAEVLGPIVDFLSDEVASDLTLLWPIHPRTRKMLSESGLLEKISSNPDIILLQPLGYLDMLRLNMEARLILTDSGGLQEECTVLGTPCLTLRSTTERPVTLKEHGGASVLVGNDINTIREAYRTALTLSRNPVRPELWDGHTAERCLEAILRY